MVAAAPNHPLASKSILRDADLTGQDFVSFDDDLRVGREVKRFLRESGLQVNIVMHFDNIQTMKEAVALGTGALSLKILIRNPIKAWSDVSQGRDGGLAGDPQCGVHAVNAGVDVVAAANGDVVAPDETAQAAFDVIRKRGIAELTGEVMAVEGHHPSNFPGANAFDDFDVMRFGGQLVID